jgi:hypothetical protein
MWDNFVVGIGERNHHLIRGGDFLILGKLGPCYLASFLNLYSNKVHPWEETLKGKTILVILAIGWYKKIFEPWAT